jgi:hypothetical protein
MSSPIKKLEGKQIKVLTMLYKTMKDALFNENSSAVPIKFFQVNANIIVYL